MLLADRVLFIDAEAMVVDKPAGLPVDAPRDGALSVASHADMLRFGFQRPPVAAHRLDRDTSGCLLLARNPRALKKFGAAFEAGQVDKTYIAVLSGEIVEADGVIDLPLAKISSKDKGWRMVVDAKHGKPARTHWRRLATGHGRTLVEFRPQTGRTHQLRVHAATGLGAPIAGDPVYGDGIGPMLLHALSLSLPRDGKPPISATAPLPPHFVDAGFAEVPHG